MSELTTLDKTKEQLERDHLVRVTLEAAAKRIEKLAGSSNYSRAWKRAAIVVREMKP